MADAVRRDKQAAFEAALERLGAERAIQLRNRFVREGELRCILETAGRTDDERPRFKTVDFRGVTFERADDAFNGATFESEADFRGATFQQGAGFEGATFMDSANFRGAKFPVGADFTNARFADTADFGDARFGGRPSSGANFSGVTFEGRTRFDGATFTARSGFPGATFERACELGPLLSLSRFVLDSAVFQGPVSAWLSASVLTCEGTSFMGGARLAVRWADVALEDASFQRPSTLYSSSPFWLYPLPRGGLDDSRLERPGKSSRARVVSLRVADVADLTLYDIDLRACMFHGAHNLDRLRVERCTFAETPRVRHWRPLAVPARWTRRRTIAEEHEWRSRQPERNEGWYRGDMVAPDWVHKWPKPSKKVEPTELTAIYRALRKGLEDAKDEPGATDFYYGEMEMRRAACRATAESQAADERPTTSRSSEPDPDNPGEAQATPWPERVTLFLYWLFSGYGLRASRALTALCITVLLFAVLLYLAGLNDRDISTALLLSLEGAAFRAGDQKILNEVGQYLQLPLRLLGPLFVGLALLSLRGRVKR